MVEEYTIKICPICRTQIFSNFGDHLCRGQWNYCKEPIIITLIPKETYEIDLGAQRAWNQHLHKKIEDLEMDAKVNELVNETLSGELQESMDRGTELAIQNANFSRALQEIAWTEHAEWHRLTAANEREDAMIKRAYKVLQDER